MNNLNGISNIRIQVLMADKRNTRHILHLILTLISVGVWLPIWLLCILYNSICNYSINREIKNTLNQMTVEASFDKLSGK